MAGQKGNRKVGNNKKSPAMMNYNAQDRRSKNKLRTKKRVANEEAAKMAHMYERRARLKDKRGPREIRIWGT